MDPLRTAGREAGSRASLSGPWAERGTRAAAVLLLAGAAVAERVSFIRRTAVYPYDAYYYLGTAQSLADLYTAMGRQDEAAKWRAEQHRIERERAAR